MRAKVLFKLNCRIYVEFSGGHYSSQSDSQFSILFTQGLRGMVQSALCYGNGRIRQWIVWSSIAGIGIYNFVAEVVECWLEQLDFHPCHRYTALYWANCLK